MAQKLKLHSPVGSEALILKWPIATSEGKEGPEEVVDTIRLVCEDFPELTTPLATRILKQGEDVSNYDYEQTKGLCDRYNKAIDSIRQLIKGSPRLKQLSKKASRKQLKHILQQCYNQSVKDPEKLNHYEPFSPEVYGETSFELVEQMIKSVKFSDSDYFIDLGSGVGQVVLQVSAATDCKFCYGIEKAEWPAEYAVGMEREFRKWMKWYGKEHGNFLIEKGDFLYDNVKDKLNKATIVFVNNFAFGPKVDHELKQRFANCLKEGARIVSSKAFCPLNFRITERNLSDIGTIMQVEELSPLCGAVSWTGKPFAYYVHTIDRTLLEKYFQRLRNPCKKQDENEPRKDRKGRPVMSIKDKINGALSGASDSNSTSTSTSSRWRRSRLQDSHSDTASPLLSSAIKMLDFDSCSNSSQVSNSCSSASVLGGQENDHTVVYGPTTRRQWNEYVKRPQSRSQSCTENDDSSNGDGNKEGDIAKAMKQKKKRMKTMKRLNNGVLGKRQLQQKQGRKPKAKEPESPPVKSKVGFKLRPRQKQQVPNSDGRAVKAGGGLAGAGAGQQHGKAHGQAGVLSQPPSLDSLNLLHAHTIMSTSGKESVDSVHYNDRRMTETSSAYFKPTVQKQTVSMLEKQAGFLDMIENMKQRFLSFLTFMQTPQYKAMLLLQIEQEKMKNAELQAKTENLEKDISVLQKDGLGLIKDRLRDMGIKAATPRELLSQAKDIVLSHKELQAQTASLGAQINALQAEHTQKVTMYKKALDKKLSSRTSKNGVTENAQQPVTGQGSTPTSQKHQDPHQKLLIASVDRLHAELQQLQDVNQNYTRPSALTAVSDRHHISNSRIPHLSSADGGDAEQTRTFNCANTNSFVLKEKLDMKENYDTFGEVLATLKEEIISNANTQQHQAEGKLLQPVKLEPKVEKQTKASAKPRTILSSSSSSTTKSSLVSSPCLNGKEKASGQQESTSLNANSFTSNSKDRQQQQSKGPPPKSIASSLTRPVGSAKFFPDQMVPSTSLTVVSSSWTTHSKSNETSASSSPRILPLGTKIDIKKPSKVGANGIRSPPVSLAKGKVVNTKPIVASGPTLLHNQSNGLVVQNVKSSSHISNQTAGSSYTENEKSAAEDLISLKEGFAYAISSPVSALQQQPHQQQQQHKTLNNITSFPNLQSLSLLQNSQAESKVVTLSKLQTHKANSFILPKSRSSHVSPNKRSRHPSNTSTGSAGQPIIIPEPSSSILYAHPLVPTSSLSPAQQQQHHHYHQEALIKPASVKIVSSLQQHPLNGTIATSPSNGSKHKASDQAISILGGPSSPKFRTLEPKCDGKKLSSLLASPPAGSSPCQSPPEVCKQRSTVRHLLTAPTIPAVSIGMSHSASMTTMTTTTTPSGTDHLQCVTVQTLQHTGAANNQGNSTAQPALLKLLQQQNNQGQHFVVTPKAASKLIGSRPGHTCSAGSIVVTSSSSSTINSSQGSKGALISALPSSVLNRSASEHKGQPVKFIPSNGFDGKDLWIVVMQNNQAGGPAAAPPGTMLNGQPQ